MLIIYGRLNPDFIIILLTSFQFKNHFAKNKNTFQRQSDANLYHIHLYYLPIPAILRSKVWVCGHSLAGIAGSNPAVGMIVSLW